MVSTLEIPEHIEWKESALRFDGTVDLLVIGGGINGAGIARDAAGRGLSVVLCEQGDLASATSSASSKLIHGGLRYLEHYAFRLVREALCEREVLLANAPHLIRPLRFVLPHDGSLRPAWMIRAGLLLYDRLGGRRQLPRSAAIDLATAPEGAPLQPHLRKGFVYSDCQVDDARLVVLNARGAADLGARIVTRTRCLSARRDGGTWTAVLRDERSGDTATLRARMLVNAAGPWADPVFEMAAGSRRKPPLRLVKGSHMVVARHYDGEHAYILQNSDRRVVFALPFEQGFTLIGTTDMAFEGDPAEVRADAAEIAYLCAAVNRFFHHPLTPADVVWCYAGVRPLEGDLADDPANISRDYSLDLDVGPTGKGAGGVPLLSVLGGKITTYRKLAEHALARLAPFSAGDRGPWTATAPLPGGDLPAGNSPVGDPERYAARLQREHPWLAAGLAGRYARAYGTRTTALLGDARATGDLGQDFGAGLHEREVAYLAENEWAETAEDILWRRSKLGLRVTESAAAALDEWLAGAPGNRRAPAP